MPSLATAIQAIHSAADKIMKSLGVLLLLTVPASAATITFEDLIEGDILGSQYSGQGVLFNRGTAYMAGSLLNEIDFPPHSPVMAIVDIGGPIEITITTAGVSGVSAYVSFLAPLTWTAYEGSSIVGSVTTAIPELLGASMLFGISVPGSSLTRLVLSGAEEGESFIMDDLTVGASAIPEPATWTLALGFLAFVLFKRRLRNCSRGALIVTCLLAVGMPMSAQVLRRINSLTAVPDYTYTGKRVTVTIMAAVEPNADLIRTSITLVELAPDGRTLRTLGAMYDDGTRGDAVANDYTYTTQVEFLEASPTERRFKASAAYRRSITRVQSGEVKVRFAPPAFAEPHDSGSIVRESELAEFPVNELVVRIAKGVDLYSTGTSLATATGGRIAGQVPSVRVVLLKYSSVKSIADLAVKENALKAHPSVVSVTRNYIAIPESFENDMTDLKSAGGGSAAYERVKAFEAWEFLDGLKQTLFPCDASVETCVSRTVIGVADTGVRATHREFSGIPIHAVRTGADADSNGHGTSVAGIIAARNHRTMSAAPAGHMNGIMGGVPGASGGSRVSYALQVGNFGAAANMLADMENAIANSARVINMSYSWSLASARTDDAWRNVRARLDSTSFNSVRSDYAEFFAEHPNVTFVASAGNYDFDSQNIIPGGIDGSNVITVGAMGIAGTDDGSRSVWGTMPCTGEGCTTGRAASCFGSSVDIAAPGELIYAPTTGADDAYTHTFNGTSGAAPFVSGTAGLLLAIRPSLTPAEIMQILRDTADPLSTDQPIGNLLNIYAAVLFVARPVDVFLLTDMTGSFSDDLATFKSQASALVDGLAAAGLDAYVGLGRFEDYPIYPYGYAEAGDRAYTRVLDLLPIRKWDPNAAANKTTILNAINSLSTRSGSDFEESQLPALYQAATGAGQILSPPEASIPAGQQANFRPNSLRIIVLWTDAGFHEGAPYPGPSWETTTAALNDKNIKVIGILAGGNAGARAGLTRAAQGTNTLVGAAGVDCDGNGTVDVPASSPLVCSISTNGAGIRQAIINSVISLAK